MNNARHGSHRCDHIGILTDNAGALISFYTEKLDFTVEKEEILSSAVFNTIFGFAADCRFIRLSAGALMIELFEPVRAQTNARTPHTNGFNHFGYCVQNKPDYVRRLRTKNVAITEVNRNNHMVYFVNDPDGNRIEIRECVTEHARERRTA